MIEGRASETVEGGSGKGASYLGVGKTKKT